MKNEIRQKIKKMGYNLINRYKIFYRIKDWREFVNKNTESYHLSKVQEKKIKDFYKPYFKKISPCFHNWYVEKCGDFDVRYIPSDYYYSFIDPFYNNWEHADFYGNKCMYDIFFYDIDKPTTVAMRMNGQWFDAARKNISISECIELINTYEKVVIKIATVSCGGHGVFFYNRISGRDELKKIISSINSDIMIQLPVIQNSVLSKLNASSVNTIRVTSFLSDNGVEILASTLRMGRAGKEVDNESSGGITCGISKDGSLKRVGHNKNGDKFLNHPDSKIKFDGYNIPSYNKVLQVIKAIHPRLPHFRLISWDFTIGEHDEPVFIETNLNYGGLEIQQLNNGPLFGDKTLSILNEVKNNHKDNPL